MGLATDRPERDRTGREAFDDSFGGFDLVDRNLVVENRLKHVANGDVFVAFLIGSGLELLEYVTVVASYSVLQIGNSVGIPHVAFTGGTPQVKTTKIEPEVRWNIVRNWYQDAIEEWKRTSD